METTCPVKLLQTTKSTTLESHLATQLASLSSSVSSGEYLKRTRKAAPAVRTGKDVHYFRRLREQHFAEILQIPEIPHWSTLRDAMQEEESSCLQSDFTAETLPLILHQFFVDRIDSVVRQRLMYMQRWARYHGCKSTTATVYEDYRRQLGSLMAEYDDCIQRADRLASAQESFLNDKPVKLGIVQAEDVNIFLRDLVLKQQGWKKVAAFLTMLKWLPHRHYHDLAAPIDVETWEREADKRNPLTKLRAMTPRASVQWKIAFERRRSNANPADVREVAASKLVMSSLAKAFKPSSEKKAEPAAAVAPPKPRGDKARVYCVSSRHHAYNSTSNAAAHVNTVQDYRGVLERLLVTYDLPASWDLDVKADQLEMFQQVSQRFKSAMERQSKQMVFRVYQYPQHLEEKTPETAQETRTNCDRAWLKEANWLDDIKLVPTVDPVQEEVYSLLAKTRKTDELLRLASQSCHLHNADKVMYSLKRHTATCRKPPLLRATVQPGDKQSPALARMWEQILQGVDPFDPSFQVAGSQSQNLPDDAKRAAGSVVDPFAQTKSRSFDFTSAQRVLKEQPDTLFTKQQQQGTDLQDSFTAFMMLRHLRIRDLQRTALSIFNYFRSLERTIAIGMVGLAKAKQPGRVPMSHAYVFEKPSDFQVSNTEFMEIQEVANHDDFYTMERGRLHVKDQWFYYIMYDAAVEDLKKLESDLVQLGSYYLIKHNANKGAATPAAREPGRSFLPTEPELSALSGQPIDRFAVLLDLWNCHVGFLERKQALLDCYLDAYHNVYDKREKERLAQVMTDIMHQRPRHVLEAQWFVRCYQLENACLDVHKEIIQSLLSSQITAQRQFLKALHRSPLADQFGIPLAAVAKFPIMLSATSQIEQVYFLEFQPSLCMASRIPAAVQHALKWTCFQRSSQRTHSVLRNHHAILELALRKLSEAGQLSQCFSPEIKTALFHNSLLENPSFLVSLVALQTASGIKAAGGESIDIAEKKKATMAAYCDVIELATVFNRLGNACLECTVVTKAYTELSNPLGFGPMHAHMRMASIDVAANNPGGTPKTSFFATAVTTEGREVFDQYSPVFCPLGVNEIDDRTFVLAIDSKDDIIKALSASAMDSLRTILFAQVAQKNALTVGLLHVHTCSQIHKTSAALEHVEAAVNSSESEIASWASGKASTRVSSAQLVVGLDLVKQLNGVYLSLQLNKVAARDAMLQELLSQPGIASKLQSPKENQKVKCAAVSKYFSNLAQLLAPQALRVQLARCMFSLDRILLGFPATRDAVFECGRENDDKSTSRKPPPQNASASQVLSASGVTQFEPSFRPGRSRPRTFMSADGKHLMNLFFLPHPLEIMSMFQPLDLDKATDALSVALRLLSSLHDIVSIISARAKLRCPLVSASPGTGSEQPGSAPVLNAYSSRLNTDQGGLEGIASELMDIQYSVQQLACPTDPVQVAEYLEGVRSTQYSQLQVVVRDLLPATLLEAGDETGAEIVRTQSRQCIDAIANVNSGCLACWEVCSLPQPLHVMKRKAATDMPWSYFLISRGPFPHCPAPPSELVASVRSAFCSLDRQQIDATQGVFCELVLLQDEVCRDAAAARLQEAEAPAVLAKSSSKLAMSSASIKSSSLSTSRMASATSAPISAAKSTLPKPIADNVAHQDFMALSLRLGELRTRWLVQQCGEAALRRSRAYSTGQMLYRSTVFEKALNGKRPRSQTLTSSWAGGVTEMDMRKALVEVLVDAVECSMLTDLQNRVTHDVNQLQTEMIQDDDSLPTEVWKKLYTKIGISIPQSAVVANLSDSLLDMCTESGDNLVISKKDFEACFQSAGQASMVRDHQLYDCYSSYYESLVQKAQHQLLVKEQEIDHWREQHRLAITSVELSAQDLLVEQCYPILMEVIALRVCLQSAEDALDRQSDHVRAEVHRHYTSLVSNLFKTSYAVKKKMEDYRYRLFSDVIQRVGDVKTTALASMQRVREEALAPLDSTKGSTTDVTATSSALSVAARELPKTVDLQLDNASLVTSMFQERSLNQWQRESSKQVYLKQLVDLQLAMDRLRSENLDAQTATGEASEVTEEHRTAMKKRLLELEERLNESESKARTERLENDKRRRREQIVVPLHELYQPTPEEVEKLKEALEEKDASLTQLAQKASDGRLQSAVAEARAKKGYKQLQDKLEQERRKKVEAYGMMEKLLDDQDRSNSTGRQARGPVAASSRSTTALLSADFRPMEFSPKTPGTHPARSKSAVTPKPDYRRSATALPLPNKLQSRTAVSAAAWPSATAKSPPKYGKSQKSAAPSNSSRNPRPSSGHSTLPDVQNVGS